MEEYFYLFIYLKFYCGDFIWPNCRISLHVQFCRLSSKRAISPGLRNKQFSCQQCTLAAKTFLLFIIVLQSWANPAFLSYNKLHTLAHVMKLSGRWKWRMDCTSVQRICFCPNLYFGTCSLAWLPVSSSVLWSASYETLCPEEPSIVFHRLGGGGGSLADLHR